VNDSAATGPVAIVCNPTAGRGRHRDALTAAVARLRRGGREVTLIDPLGVDAAVAACHDAIHGGATALIAAGGDGTVNLALQAAAESGVGFGVLPVGTGNDFAVELGLPREAVAAADVIADALDHGERRLVDLAHMTPADGPSRWYGAVLGAGFDSFVNERANAMRFPRGPRRYDLAILAELARLTPRRYTMRLDGVEHHFDGVLVAVGNTASYGGGMRICPNADPSDGMLDVVIAGRVGRAALMRIKPKVYAGAHLAHPLVTSYRAKTVELDADGIIAYVDGERSSALPVTVVAVPGALSLLAPPQTRADGAVGDFGDSATEIGG
jgi:diacylglycerol kinase (ATP)